MTPRQGTLTWGGAGWTCAGSVQRWSRRRGWCGWGDSRGRPEAGEDVRVGVDRMVGSVAHGQHSVERVNTGGRGRHLPWLLSDHSLVRRLRRTWPTWVSWNSLKQTEMRGLTGWRADGLRCDGLRCDGARVSDPSDGSLSTKREPCLFCTEQLDHTCCYIETIVFWIRYIYLPRFSYKISDSLALISVSFISVFNQKVIPILSEWQFSWQRSL